MGCFASTYLQEPAKQVTRCADDPLTREWSLQEVVEPLVHDYRGDIITLEVAGEKLEATGNHPFWVVSGADLAGRPYSEHAGAQNHDFRFGKWVEARSVRVGDVVLLRSGKTVKVASLSSRQATTKVYNIHVALLHSYAVGHAGVLVHNNSYGGVPKANFSRKGGAGRSRNDLRPDPRAMRGEGSVEGAHTVFRRDSSGRVAHYESYRPQRNPNNPNPWEPYKRFDATGEPHFNKPQRKYVPAPHTQGPNYNGGVRPARRWEIPKGW